MQHPQCDSELTTDRRSSDVDDSPAGHHLVHGDWVLERVEGGARIYRRPDGGLTKVYDSIADLLDD